MYASQTHFDFINIGSKVHHFWVISIWKVKNISGTPCTFLTKQILVNCKQLFGNILQESVSLCNEIFDDSFCLVIEEWLNRSGNSTIYKLQNCSQILAKLWWLQKRLNHIHKNQMLNLPQQLLIASRFEFFASKNRLEF